jgi:hypothetical protein
MFSLRRNKILNRAVAHYARRLVEGEPAPMPLIQLDCDGVRVIDRRRSSNGGSLRLRGTSAGLDHQLVRLPLCHHSLSGTMRRAPRSSVPPD